MDLSSISQLSSQELMERMAATFAKARETRAELLAHLDAADEHELYRPEGYRSMWGYCVGHLHMEEDEVAERLEAARTARRFPAILDAIADGRLHEESVLLLAPWLAPDTAGELIAAVARKTREEIEALLDARYPDRDRFGILRAVSPEWDTGLQAAMEAHAADPYMADLPLPTRWYELRVVVPPATRDSLLQAKAVVGNEVPPGDLAGALGRVLTVFLEDHA